MQAKAQLGFDAQGMPTLQMQVGERLVKVGASAANVLSSGAPSELVQKLLEARLEAELSPKTATVSEKELVRDWQLRHVNRTRALRQSLLRPASVVRHIFPGLLG